MPVVGRFPMHNQSSTDEHPGLTSTPQKRVVSVLVVDDCPDIVASMAMLLRLYGHEVYTALEGPAALLVARVKRPDVVLMDISMPGMSGYEVARQMRAMFHDEVTLIAITANGSEEDRRRSFDAGFDCHFVKPADPEEVEELLRELASYHHQYHHGPAEDIDGVDASGGRSCTIGRCDRLDRHDRPSFR